MLLDSIESMQMHVPLTFYTIKNKNIWNPISCLTVVQKHMDTESEITTDFIDKGVN